MIRALFLLLPLAACAAPDLMTEGAVTVPPAAAISWGLGVRYSSHAAPDCNDYAKVNAARLRAVGDHPRFAVAYTETGEGHMVVTVDDPRRGTLVYDNRYPQHPRYWRSLPYRWVERQSARNANEWRTVGAPHA